MSGLYWTDCAGRRFELEAGTRAMAYGWFRDLETGESVRLRFADLLPVGDEAMQAESKDRSNFERWTVECGLSIKRHTDGVCSYVDSATLWAWQAALAQAGAL